MQVLKASATLSDIKLETLESLSARLASKKTGLGKKAGKDSSATITEMLDKVNSGKVQVSSVVEVIKVVVAFQKKRSRKLAVAVGEKMHALRAHVGTFDTLPMCLSLQSALSKVFMLASDQKWVEATTACSVSSLEWEMGFGMDTSTLALVQKQAGILCLAERVRWMSSEKLPEPSVTKRLAECSEELGKNSGEPLKQMTSAITVAMKNEAGVEDLRQALSLFVCCFALPFVSDIV